MDSSDGLSTTLNEMAKQSKCKFVINNIPCKKDIKELPNVKSYLHSVKIKSGNFTIICEIVLTFKRNTRWEMGENIKSEIINYLEGLGYNKNRLIVRKL